MNSGQIMMSPKQAAYYNQMLLMRQQAMFNQNIHQMQNLNATLKDEQPFHAEHHNDIENTETTQPVSILSSRPTSAGTPLLNITNNSIVSQLNYSGQRAVNP